MLQAEGRDTRGQGNASATVTATLAADGDGTTVNIDTDLNITGKVAQFGRGVMADVSSKLLGQFADNLKQRRAQRRRRPTRRPRHRHRAGGATATPRRAGRDRRARPTSAGPRKIESPEAAARST